MTNWIKTQDQLPKDGDVVLAFWEGLNSPQSVLQFGGGAHWNNPEDDEDNYLVPTHWMPLPEPPTE